MFWIMVVIALSFIVIAIAMIAIAVFVNRAVKSVGRLEGKMEPLIERVTLISEQGKEVAVQGKFIGAVPRSFRTPRDCDDAFV